MAAPTLVEYASDEDGEQEDSPKMSEDKCKIGEGSGAEQAKLNPEDFKLHLKPRRKNTVSTLALDAAPVVAVKPDDGVRPLDIVNAKEVKFNPKYDDLFAPQVGPLHPFKTKQQAAKKNTLAGFVEQAHVNDFVFESQRRTFNSYGYAMDPSVIGAGAQLEMSERTVGDKQEELKHDGTSVFEPGGNPENKRRKREKGNWDPEDVEGYQGPWRKFEGEETVSIPEPEVQKEMDEFMAKKRKHKKKKEEETIEEKSTLHIDDPVDYQGRSFIHAPKDRGSLRVPDRCFIPKKLIHTWTGHTKGVAAIRWFPKSAHLIMSVGMDCRVKLWEVNGQRRCVRTYHGHKQAVRDANFNNDGTHFLSAGYDRYIKLWDTEKGDVISRFTNKKVAYCVKFHPDPSKQHLFVAGTSDKKIVAWDTRSGESVQEYDRHLGAVNTITFLDEGRRFVSTSDDKSLRFWEWDIPVDFKYIADPSMHSMPYVTVSPNGKWLACQSMDNRVYIYTSTERYHRNRKKTFQGHMVAGYACGVDFSPDLSYIMSGDADGKCYIWDWKTCRITSRFKAHNSVCVGALWHPFETSKIATCGWDGVIKYWD